MADVPTLDLNKKSDYGEVSYNSDDEEYEPEDYGDDDNGSDPEVMPEWCEDEEDGQKEQELYDEYDDCFGPEGTMCEFYTEDDPSEVLPMKFCPRPECESDSQSDNSTPDNSTPDNLTPDNSTSGTPTNTATAEANPEDGPLRVPPPPTAAAEPQPTPQPAAAAAANNTEKRKIHVFTPSKWTKSETLVRVDGLPDLDEHGKLFNTAKFREIVQERLNVGSEKINCRLTYPHGQQRGVPVPHLGWGVIDVLTQEDVPVYVNALHTYTWNSSTFTAAPMLHRFFPVAIPEDQLEDQDVGDYQYIMDRKSKTIMAAWLRDDNQPQRVAKPIKGLAGAPPSKHKGVMRGQLACGRVLEILNKVEDWEKKGEEAWSVNNSVFAYLDFETAYIGKDYIKPVEVGGIIGTLAGGIKNEFGTLMHPGGINDLHEHTAVHVSMRVPTCVPYKNCTALRHDYATLWGELIEFLRPASAVIVKGLENHVDKHAFKWLCAAACVKATPEKKKSIEAERDEVLTKFVDYMAVYRALEAVHLRNTTAEDKIVAGPTNWIGQLVGLCGWANDHEEFDTRTGKDGVETLLGRDSKSYLVTPDAEAHVHCCEYHQKFLEIQCEWETTLHCAQRDAALGWKALMHAVQKEFPTVSAEVHTYQRGMYDFTLEMYRTPWSNPLHAATGEVIFDEKIIQEKFSTGVQPTVNERWVEEWTDNGPSGWGENAAA